MPIIIRRAPPHVGTGRARAASEDGPTTYIYRAASAQFTGRRAASVKVGASEPALEPHAAPAPPRKAARPRRPTR